MNDSFESSAQGPAPWLLILPQIPTKPDYFRVKIRRRLHQIGAILVKHGVYAVPATEEAMEDIRWLRGEIVAEGGDAILCRAQFIEGFQDDELAPAMPMTACPPRGTTWVTRRGVKADRTASAWLIRGFVDPDARFAFVVPEGYRPAKDEVRFDMFDGEFTHEGDRCTFEVLCARFGLRDPALQAIGEIVHDLDCKDQKFRRPETLGVGAVIDGILKVEPSDEGRLTATAVLYGSLYQQFSA